MHDDAVDDNLTDHVADSEGHSDAARKFILGGVRGKLTVLLLVFSLVPALILFGILYNQEADIKHVLTNDVAATAQSLNDVIDRNLFERYGDVQAFGLNSAAQDSKNWNRPGVQNPLVNAMNGYMTGYGIYKLMLLVAGDGTVIAANSVDATGKALATSELYGTSMADRPWFKDAIGGKFLNGKNGVTGTAVGQPRRERLVAELYGADGYVIPFSAPVRNSAGKTIGVWVNFADFGLVEEISAIFHETLAAKNMANAEITILDPEGRVIVDYDPQTYGFKELSGYKRNFDVIGKLNLVTLGVEAAARAVKGGHGATVSIHGRKKIAQASGFSHSVGVYGYPGLGWSVLVRIPDDEAFALWDTLILKFVIALVMCGILFTIGGLLIGNRAAQPLRVVTAAMNGLAGGDNTIEVPIIDQRDELGEMGRAVAVWKRNRIEREALIAARQEKEKLAAEQEHKRVEDDAVAARQSAEEQQRVADEQRKRAESI